MLLCNTISVWTVFFIIGSFQKSAAKEDLERFYAAAKTYNPVYERGGEATTKKSRTTENNRILGSLEIGRKVKLHKD